MEHGIHHVKLAEQHGIGAPKLVSTERPAAHEGLHAAVAEETAREPLHLRPQADASASRHALRAEGERGLNGDAGAPQ
jgi:hypothetical protein